MIIKLFQLNLLDVKNIQNLVTDFYVQYLCTCLSMEDKIFIN